MRENVDCPFRAIAVDDETGAEFDNADYDDLDEAIRFAAGRHWDYVMDVRTGRTVWRYGMPVRGGRNEKPASKVTGRNMEGDGRGRRHGNARGHAGKERK